MRDNLEELNGRGLRRHPRAARRRRADAHLRRARPARGLRGPAVLRQGRVRGPAGHGPPGRAQAGRRRADDPDWGRVPTESRVPARASARRPSDDGGARIARRARPRSRPTTRSSCRRSSARRSSRASRSTTSPPTSTRPRCSATSGSSGPRRRPTDRSRATTSSRPASARSCGRSWPRPRRGDLLVPQVVYGYFAANGDGDDLVIWKDETRTSEWLRFSLPPPVEGAVPVHRRLLPARRRRARSTTPRSTSSRWASACQRAHRRAVRRRTSTRSTCSLHGLGVEMAEALAEYWHHRIREEWGFADEDGPTLDRAVPPAVPRRPLLVGLPGLPRPRGQREGGRAARRRPHRHRGQRGDRVPVPARADHLGHHLPPPQGQVLRRPVAPPVAGTGRRRHIPTPDWVRWTAVERWTQQWLDDHRPDARPIGPPRERTSPSALDRAEQAIRMPGAFRAVGTARHESLRRRRPRRRACSRSTTRCWRSSSTGAARWSPASRPATSPSPAPACSTPAPGSPRPQRLPRRRADHFADPLPPTARPDDSAAVGLPSPTCRPRSPSSAPPATSLDLRELERLLRPRGHHRSRAGLRRHSPTLCALRWPTGRSCASAPRAATGRPDSFPSPVWTPSRPVSLVLPRHPERDRT